MGDKCDIRARTHTLMTPAEVENSVLCAVASERPWQEYDISTVKQVRLESAEYCGLLLKGAAKETAVLKEDTKHDRNSVLWYWYVLISLS
jgi:hypothetical protein